MRDSSVAVLSGWRVLEGFLEVPRCDEMFSVFGASGGNGSFLMQWWLEVIIDHAVSGEKKMMKPESVPRAWVKPGEERFAADAFWVVRPCFRELFVERIGEPRYLEGMGKLVSGEDCSELLGE